MPAIVTGVIMSGKAVYPFRPCRPDLPARWVTFWILSAFRLDTVGRPGWIPSGVPAAPGMSPGVPGYDCTAPPERSRCPARWPAVARDEGDAMRRTHVAVITGLLTLLVGCSGGGPPSGASPSGSTGPAISGPPGGPAGTAASGSTGTGLPRPAHVVVVVEENHSPGYVFGSSAPYLTALARQGATFTNSYGVGRPSEPNYLGLFSGSTHGLTDDSCPHTYSSTNLGAQLAAAGLSFTGYAESMPGPGYTGCYSGDYARKHAPWVNFTNVPASGNQPFTSFPSDHALLPTVSFVVPNLCNDMHDCPVATGDAWLRTYLGGYVNWAAANNSLLIVTFDEGEGGGPNQVPTVFVGPMVRPGTVSTTINHYTVLRTIEAMYGLPCAGQACAATPITGIWR